MLINISAKEYKQRFCVNSHPFISEEFIDLNKGKTEKVVRLIENKQRVDIGLIAGISNGILMSPFSAPFGGFHYRNEYIYISEIDFFLDNLLSYCKRAGIEKINIILPPTLYQHSINAKMVNSLLRKNFRLDFSDITHWIEIKKNNIETAQRRRRYIRQAIENNLIFESIEQDHDKRVAYEIVYKNRENYGRPIHMAFEDLVETNMLWPVDFFCVKNQEKEMLASGILYQFPNNVVYAVFWGDNNKGRCLRAMDFLIHNIIKFYKSAGFNYIDFGTSTDMGEPNIGLLRFKDTFNCVSGSRFKFSKEIL